jgi:hypothetical protein
MRPSRPALALCLAALFPLACGDGTPTIVPTPTPTPTPTPPTGVVVGPHTGPTEIAFLSADPAPGSTIAGCGAVRRLRGPRSDALPSRSGRGLC